MSDLHPAAPAGYEWHPCQTQVHLHPRSDRVEQNVETSDGIPTVTIYGRGVELILCPGAVVDTEAALAVENIATAVVLWRDLVGVWRRAQAEQGEPILQPWPGVPPGYRGQGSQR
jgi:hypothetical protein